MTENKEFRRGIIFAFCYSITCFLLGDLLLSLILFLKVNVIIVPFFFLLLFISILYMLKRVELHIFNIFWLVFLLLLQIVINVIGFPAKLYLGTYSLYTFEEQQILSVSRKVYKALCVLILLYFATKSSKNT